EEGVLIIAVNRRVIIEFEAEFEESLVTLLWSWVVAILWSLVVGMGRNDDQNQLHLLHGGGAAAAGSDSGDRTNNNNNTNGFIPNSFHTLSGYLKKVSSGASTAARSVAASFASPVLDNTDHDQVIWAGFDTLEGQGEVARKVLLLGYSSGFQVWDVDDSSNVHDLVYRQDNPVSFMQMVPSPIVTKRLEDKFADRRPLLAVCTNDFLTEGGLIQDGLIAPYNGAALNHHDQVNGNYLSTTIQFYSLRSQSYVNAVKFRSAVYSVRCSCRIVAISQFTQIHCLSVTTLETEYTLLTNPIVTGCLGSGGIGFGPLAVGPRWLAYSGSPAVTASSGHVCPQHLTTSASFPGFSSNGSLVAHYAKESSKHLAAGIMALGDVGYRKFSKYCSELLSDSSGSIQFVNSSSKENRIVNDHSTEVDNIGMVIVRDIVSKNVIAQFQAHKSPISALCFDPSGTILVTASDQGHNINVFKIIPGYERVSASDTGPSYVHLYRLQRGFTNAVIQDISFSADSRWIMISSSRGTSHLFAINPQGGPVNIVSRSNSLTEKNGQWGAMTNQAVRWPHSSALEICKQQSFCATGPPIALSVVSRIWNGSNGWISTVTGAVATATNRMSSLSGAIASFRNFEGSSTLCVNRNYSKEKYHLLTFSSIGSMTEYVVQTINSQDSDVVSGLTPSYESAPLTDARVVVEPVQKWNVRRRHSWREEEDNIDIYGENGISGSNEVYSEQVKKDNIISPKFKNEHHLYISEAELQMHQAKTPLWTKSQIYFHSVDKEAIVKMDGEAALGGEFEIENIPSHVKEAKSKDLVSKFDYIHTSKVQQTRFGG
ncbi:Autophagy-related protein 18f, partial [Mucuna pruriens]